MERYHIRRLDRQVTDKDELLSILKDGQHAVIAMCRDNEPYVVTLSYGLDETEGALYFHVGQAGQKVSFIESNPNVCATVFDGKGFVTSRCRYSYRSVVLKGRIEAVSDLATKKRSMEKIMDHLWSSATPEDRQLATSEESLARVNMWKLKWDEITGKKSV